MARVASIEAVLSLDATQWDKTLKRSTANLKKMATDSRAIAAGAGVILASASAGLGSLAADLYSAGQNALDLRKSLDAAFDGFELEQVTQQVRELGATPPYSAEQFAQAAKAFKTFGGNAQSITKDLVNAGNVAAATGAGFDTIAKAMAAFGVDDRATLQLEKLANITPEKLVEFGAVLDETTGKIDFTGINAEKAKNALREFAETNYAGAMDQVVTATDALSGSFQLLKEDAGAALTEIGEGIAGQLLPAVEYIRELPGPVKAAAGGLVALAAATAGALAGTIALGLAAGPIITGFTAGAAIIAVPFTRALWLAEGAALAMNTTLAGLALSVAGIGLAVTAVIGPLVLLTKQYELETAAQEKLLEVELARSKNQRLANQLVGKTIKQLQDEGRTAKDLANAMLALQERIEAAREAGNKSVELKLRQQVVELKQAKEELAKAEGIQRERTQAALDANTPEAKAARKKAADEVQKNREEDARKAEETRKAALNSELLSIELRLAQEEITQKESLALRAAALEKFKASEEEKTRLAIESAKTLKSLEESSSKEAAQSAEEQKAKAESVRKAALAAQQESINLQKSSGSLTKDAELDAIEDILRNFKLSQDERIVYKREAAQLETQIAEDAANKQKRIDQQLASELAKTRDLERDAIGDEIDRLQKESQDSGKDNSQAIQAAIQQSLALQVESIRAEAERAKAAAEGAEVREQIEKNAQLQIQDAIRETAKTEKQALGEQKNAVNELRDVRKEAEKEAKGFGKDPYGIEDLNQSILDSLSVKFATGQEAAQQAAVASAFPDASTLTPTPISPTVADVNAQGQSRIDGEIRIAVDVTGNGKISDVTTTGLDGRFSEIGRNARGMRGRIGLALALDAQPT